MSWQPKDAAERRKELVLLSVYTDKILWGIEHLPDKAFHLTLNGFTTSNALLMDPSQDIGIGFVVQLGLDLCGVRIIIPVLLINSR